MSRRSSWQDQLRNTRAVDSFRSGRYAQFPLQEVQGLSDALLNGASTRFRRRSIEPDTLDCDNIFSRELSSISGELYAYEAGIIACIHLLTVDAATERLLSVEQKTQEVDVFFNHQARSYLQCLVLAFQVRGRDIFHQDVPEVAKALLLVLEDNGGDIERLPSIIAILQAVAKETCEKFIPRSLVKEILRYQVYQRRLKQRLDQLKQQRRWYSAWQLVGGVGKLRDKPATQGLVADTFPDIRHWAPWQPNVPRIHTWETQIVDRAQVKRLEPVLDLEGPDFTGHSRSLYRIADPGKYRPTVMREPFRNDRHILDQLVTVLQRAATKGHEAVDLFITLCVKPQISWRTLDQVEAAVELPHGKQISRLDTYMKFIQRYGATYQRRDGRRHSNTNQPSLFDSVKAYALGLQVIQSNPRLHNTFGHEGDPSLTATRLLPEAQAEFCVQLEEGRESEPFALHIGRFGRALLASRWLHAHWTPQFLAMLHEIPSEMGIKTAMHMMKASSEVRQAYCDALAVTLGGCDPIETAAGKKAVTVIGLVSDPIWSTSLEIYHATLRETILRETMRGFKASDATDCVKQSLKETDIWVYEVRDLVGDKPSDTACVKLASYLGRRCKDDRVPAQCWRCLLMHMMRTRSPGLDDRLDRELTLEQWEAWIRHLNALFGDKHYDPAEGLGFTRDKFNRVTARKDNIGRMASTSTYSTTSTTYRN